MTKTRVDGVANKLDFVIAYPSTSVGSHRTKQKAAQIGRIKEMTEDQETGSLTIVLEV